MVQELVASDEVDAAWKIEHGYKPEEAAIYIEWVPGTQWPGARTKSADGRTQTPTLPRERWVTFPKMWTGYPVHYRQGA